jgi:hypothetical protein
VLGLLRRAPGIFLACQEQRRGQRHCEDQKKNQKRHTRRKIRGFHRDLPSLLASATEIECFLLFVIGKLRASVSWVSGIRLWNPVSAIMRNVLNFGMREALITSDPKRHGSQMHLLCRIDASPVAQPKAFPNLDLCSKELVTPDPQLGAG